MAARAKKDDEVEEAAEGAEVRARPRAKAEEERGPLNALVSGLDEVVPGLEILDRELTFENGARADLACVDPAGRLVLVLVAGEDADRATLEALDAFAVLQNELELLARHFGKSGVSAERAPRLFVITASPSERLCDRLAALGDAGVAVFGLRTLKSAAGERAYLVRLHGRRPAAASPSGVPAFLRALPARLEPLGAALVERMKRLDEELEPTADATTLVWRLQGEVLCRVERVGDLLQASVAPRHEPLPLGDVAELERLIERALERLVRLLGMTRGDRDGADGAEARRGRGETPPEAPILTPEELQAFRD